MNRKNLFVASAALVMGLASGAALAHGHFHHTGARVGVHIGIPLGPVYPYPYYAYPYPYGYYYPYAPVAVAPASAPVYVEQEQTAPPAPQASGALSPGYWYYCQNPAGYYPDVKTCPGGWQQVAPQRPPQQ